MTHELKTWPEYFQPVIDGIKTFEIRKDDRGFSVGDTLILQEYDPMTKAYTGRMAAASVCYLTSFADALRAGYVCMAIQVAAVTL